MSAYIVDGRIERGSGGATSRLGIRTHFWQYLSWQRVVVLTAASGILIATNPINRHFMEQVREPTVTSWSSFFWNQERGITNYLFFAVDETYTALVFLLLGESWSCRFDDVEIGYFCDVLAPILTHGKPLLWDETDLPYTAHRILCWILVLSAAVSFCFPGAPPGRLLDNSILDSLLSVFYRPHLLLDLFHANVAVYPALVELHRILPRLRAGSIWSTGNAQMDFFLAVIILVLGIGGGANWVASQIVAKQPIYGFASVVAASMAYCQRIALLGSPILFRYEDLFFTTADLYWAELVALFLRGTRRSFSVVITWLVAALLGSALAKYHVENIAVWGGIYKFFGLS